jgi:hypothetical protein
MQSLLSEAGRSFLRAFAASIIVLAPGILAAPNLNRAVAIGIAAVMASIAAGLKAIQVFIPRLSLVAYLPARPLPLGAWADSFLRAFLAAFVTSLIGILNMPDLSGGKAAVVGALVGAFAAGFRGIQSALTRGELPFAAAGFTIPPPPVPPEAPGRFAGAH